MLQELHFGRCVARHFEEEPMQQFVMVFLGMLFFATLGYGQDSLAAPSQEAE